MTIDESTDFAFTRYRDMIQAKGYKARNSSDYPKWHELSKADQLSHALWMCEEIAKPENKHYSLDKKSRWLGFVQCCVIMHGLTSIKAERNITRPWFNKDGE